MEKHVNLLGILFIVFGAMGVIGAFVFFLLIVGGGIFSGTYAGEPRVLYLAGTFGIMITGIILITTLPAIIAGWGLLKFKPWSRILALIVGIINIPGVPFGTALGIYALWVLLKDDTIKLFDASQNQPVS
jgi:hypothetical protein